MSSSYQSLLSLSPADWIGGSEFVDDDDDRRALSAAAAVSSYLSFDIGGFSEEELSHHPSSSSEAAFHAEQQAPAPAPAAPLFGGDYGGSGVAAGSSSEGEPGKQSQTDASALSSSEGLAANNDTSSFFTSAGGEASLPLPLPRARNKKQDGKIAFKTRTDVDVLDDGYRWRKYGKKMVKNSPNPRNYYRCSVEGCQVKKRVERARDDARFVITTYDGVHNHAAAPAHPLRGYRLLDPPPPPPAHRV